MESHYEVQNMASEVNELSDAKDTCGMESKQGRVLKDKCDSNEKNSYIGILLGKFTTAFKSGYRDMPNEIVHNK